MLSSYEAGCPEREDASEQGEVAGNVANVSPDSKLRFGDGSGDHEDEGNSSCNAEKPRCKYDESRVSKPDLTLSHAIHAYRLWNFLIEFCKEIYKRCEVLRLLTQSKLSLPR